MLVKLEKGFVPGAKVEFPDMAYLLSMPFFDMAPAEDVMKYGAQFQKSLLSRAPLTNRRKNVLVTCRVNLIFPGYSPTSNRMGNTFEWHLDGSGKVQERFTEDRDIFHVILSECEARTEFVGNDVEIDISPFQHIFDLNGYLNSDAVHIDPVKIPSCQFVTFTNKHVHRASECSKPEFRFFMNITESDFMEPLPQQKRAPKVSHLYQGDKVFVNIVRVSQREIVLHEPRGGVKCEIPR